MEEEFRPQSDVSKIIDLRETLQNVEFYLRGLTYDKRTGEVVEDPSIGKKLNNQGINELMSWLKMYLNRDMAFNNINDLQIGRAIPKLYLEIAIRLLLNSNKWELQSLNDIHFLAYFIAERIYWYILHSRGGGIRKLYEETTAEGFKHANPPGFLKRISDGILGRGGEE